MCANAHRLAQEFHAALLEKPDCRHRHHPDAAAARAHNSRHYKAKGCVLECRCGRGYYVTTQAPPVPEQPRLVSRLPQRDLSRSCFRKKFYVSKIMAELVMRQRAFSGRAYPCSVCGGWHLTH